MWCDTWLERSTKIRERNGWCKVWTYSHMPETFSDETENEPMKKNHPTPSHLCDAHVTGKRVCVDPELCGNDSQQVHSHSLHGFYAITKALVYRYLALIWSKVLYKEKKNKNQQIVLARHLKVKSEDEQRVTSSWRAADSCEGLIIIVRKRHLAL